MKKLMLVLAMFTTGMVAAQSSSTTEHEKFNKIVFLVDKFYTDKDWNKNGIRENVISMCRKKLKENNLDILNPIYREVQITFMDDKNNMENLLSGKCKGYLIDIEDHVRYSWKLKGKTDTWFLITLEIESNGVRYGMSEYKN